METGDPRAGSEGGLCAHVWAAPTSPGVAGNRPPSSESGFGLDMWSLAARDRAVMLVPQQPRLTMSRWPPAKEGRKTMAGSGQGS